MKESDVRLTESRSHGGNFVEAVKTRRDPVSHIDDAVRSNFTSTLADIAIRAGRKIVWDPVKEKIVGDQQASRRLARAYRAGWRA